MRPIRDAFEALDGRTRIWSWHVRAIVANHIAVRRTQECGDCMRGFVCTTVGRRVEGSAGDCAVLAAVDPVMMIAYTR